MRQGIFYIWTTRHTGAPIYIDFFYFCSFPIFLYTNDSPSLYTSRRLGVPARVFLSGISGIYTSEHTDSIDARKYISTGGIMEIYP